MNCKPGDLAVVAVRPELTPELFGRFVVVERRAFAGETVEGSMFLPSPRDAGSAAWVVTTAASGSLLPRRTTGGSLSHVRSRVILDRLLRPIRDNDGLDETLAWGIERQRGVTA